MIAQFVFRWFLKSKFLDGFLPDANILKQIPHLGRCIHFSSTVKVNQDLMYNDLGIFGSFIILLYQYFFVF